MENHYRNVCRKIIDNYSNNLSEKEINALNKLMILKDYEKDHIVFINKIVDRIWTMTLTNPFNYTDGKPFIFLVTRDVFPIKDNIDNLKTLLEQNNHSLQLITDETVLNTEAGTFGIIVQIDYINSLSEIILPCDFIDETPITVNSQLDIKGIVNVSLNIGDYQAEEGLSSYFATIARYPKVSINKVLYNYKKRKKLLTRNDEKNLANKIIACYLIDKNLYTKTGILRIKQLLIETYIDFISKEYKKYFYNKITLDELINNVYGELEHNLTLQSFDKKM